MTVYVLMERRLKDGRDYIMDLFATKELAEAEEERRTNIPGNNGYVIYYVEPREVKGA